LSNAKIAFGSFDFWFAGGNLGLTEEISCFHAQNAREAVHDVDTRRVNTTLQSADISAVNLSTMRELFLGQSQQAAMLSQVERQYLSDFHDAKQKGL
jgi:hypothetical protein